MFKTEACKYCNSDVLFVVCEICGKKVSRESGGWFEIEANYTMPTEYTKDKSRLYWVPLIGHGDGTKHVCSTECAVALIKKNATFKKAIAKWEEEKEEHDE